MHWNACVLLIVVILSSANCLQSLSLNGQWRIKDETNGEYSNLLGTVPGGIYSDLLTNKIIEDIHYGYNDNATKWVPRTNWTYYTNFTVDEQLLSLDNVNIVFEGLDTFATIFINNVEIGKSDNMFVQFIYDVKHVLKLEENMIEIKFQSPIEVGQKLAEERAESYVIPPECPVEAYHGECYVNLIRKMQASYSWDWGPSFPSVGIWKNVYIEGYTGSKLRYLVVDVEQNSDAEEWILNVDTYYANNQLGKATGKLTITVENDTGNFTRVVEVDQMLDDNSEILLQTSLNIPKAWVKSWWPNGYGAQNLYNVHANYMDESSREISSLKQRIGFRTIELVQEKLSNGLSFYFKVNGEEIFMKGSNEIPIDILPERGQNQTIIKRVLKSARDVHMNMLRVWGGGVYESDYFYDLADEYGILIWQDFMFACAMYPATPEYTKNVIQEVRHQVKRLRSHSSVAMFAGNNENELFLVNNVYNTKDNYTLYKRDYLELYINTIESEFNRVTHKRGIFLSSSPSDGDQTVAEGGIAENPGSQLYGDVHYYNYMADGFNPNIYQIPRFASEFGFQSLPSLDSLLTTTTNKSDWNINSKFMDWRQHHPDGNPQLKNLIDFQMDFPSESREDFVEDVIYYSQISQAMSIKVQTEHYRSYRGIINSNGEGKTMGALYWQLNDVWIAPTWSGVDYTGKWKMLHYYARNFFAPVLVTGLIDAAGSTNIYLISDLMTPLYNLTLNVDVYNWNLSIPIASKQNVVDLEAGTSKLVQSIINASYLSSINCGILSEASNNCFFHLTLQNEGVPVSPSNFVIPSKLKDAKLKKAIVEIESVKNIDDTNTVFEIKVKTDQISIFVWLDAPNISGIFSDNGFLLLQNTTIYLETEQPILLEKLTSILSVTDFSATLNK